MWSLDNNKLNMKGLFEIEILTTSSKRFACKLVGGQTIFTARKQSITWKVGKSKKK